MTERADWAPVMNTNTTRTLRADGRPAPAPQSTRQVPVERRAIIPGPATNATPLFLSNTATREERIYDGGHRPMRPDEF